MEHRATDIMDSYGVPSGKGRLYLLKAIELYDGGPINAVYSAIAAMYGVSSGAVARCIALCVSAIDFEPKTTPKEFIARVKERILFDLYEY